MSSGRKGKTYEEIYGIEKAIKLKQRRRKPREVRFCECGCGECKKVLVSSMWRFFSGHNSRGFSKETIEKMRESRTGRKHSKETIRKIQKGLEGKPKTEDHKRKLREAVQGTRDGDKNGNWKGGLSFLPYGSDFNLKLKEQIKKRDNYRCQFCGKGLEELNYLTVHHIDYNKMNNNQENLITLCSGCNSRMNANREFWKRYWTNYLIDHSRIIVKEVN